MPLTAIDDQAALIVVDLQQGLLDLPTIQPLALVVERSARLADAFRARGRPVVIVTTNGSPPGRSDVDLRIVEPPSGFADPVDDLATTTTDVRVVKQGWSAFRDGTLHAALLDAPVERVIGTYFVSDCNAVKITLQRRVISASADERDVFGAQQQRPVESLTIPVYPA